MADDIPPISEAFALAAEAICLTLGVKPVPPGLSTARVGDWTLTINASAAPIDDAHGVPVQPWRIVAQHEVYIAIGVLDPFGGGIGGCSEDDFIADMRAAGARIEDPQP